MPSRVEEQQVAAEARSPSRDLRAKLREVEAFLNAGGGSPGVRYTMQDLESDEHSWSAEVFHLARSQVPGDHLRSSSGVSHVGAVPFISVRGGLSAQQFRRVCELIDARLRGPLEVVELAAVAGLRASHFTRAFKRTTGKTPHRFILDQKLERARDALSSGQAEKIAELAIEFGFFDQSHFTRHFRRKFGVTPGHIMRQTKGSPHARDAAEQASGRELTSFVSLGEPMELVIIALRGLCP